MILGLAGELDLIALAVVGFDDTFFAQEHVSFGSIEEVSVVDTFFRRVGRPDSHFKHELPGLPDFFSGIVFK